MGEVAIAALLVAVIGFALFCVAGRYAARHRAGAAARIDRILGRTVRRARAAFLSIAALAAAAVVWLDPLMPESFRVAVIYAAPLLAGWGSVLGTSWLQIRGRGLPSGLLRFHRFDLFSAYLLMGQRLPYFSAALAIPVRGSVWWPALFHLLAATVLVRALRLCLSRLAGVRPLPDARLVVEVRAAARFAGIRFRGALLVPTERGQSVNAVAATSSRLVFVAQGLAEGLNREEVRAVLLHEVGHLGQRFANAWRSLSFLGWPTLILLLRAGLVSEEAPLPRETWPRGTVLVGLLAAAGLAAALVGRLADRWSERDADDFARRHAGGRHLASALRKIYALVPPIARDRPADRAAGSLGDRLRRIEG
jgi:Zn-dependent protease with chaperone function